MLKVRTDVELSELLNIKPNTISSWKKRNSLDYDTIISICELYDLDLNALFLRKKSVGVQRNETPFLGRETQFQYASGQDRESLMDLVPKFSFPFLTSENTLAFQVTSNNMFPLLVENSVALCELSDLEEIKDAQVVVLVTHNKGIFVNKLMRNPITKGQFILDERE